MTVEVDEALTRRGIPVDPTLRILALGTLVNRAGGGLLVTTLALYFTRIVGLRPAEVGLALSLAGIGSMLAQLPAGHLGDVLGPRRVMQRLTLAGGVVSFGLMFAHDFWTLTLVYFVTNVFMVGGGAVRNGYIAQVAPGGQGVAFKAYLRAVTNTAIAFGALLGGVALWIDAPWAYLSAFALNSVCTVANGLIVGRVPDLAPAPARAAGEPRLAVLRDLPFVVITVLNGVFAMHFMVVDIGIALWISVHTSAPQSMFAVLLVLNTVAVAVFQVRLSRLAVDVGSASRAMLTGGLWIAAGFVVIAFSGSVSTPVAIGLLLAGASLHVVGEMIGSGGQWGVQMGLAPHERQGQYQGFAGMGFSVSTIIAPSLITLLCIEWGRPGWFVMAALVLGAAVLTVPASRWALATRERYGAATASG